MKNLTEQYVHLPTEDAIDLYVSEENLGKYTLEESLEIQNYLGSRKFSEMIEAGMIPTSEELFEELKASGDLDGEDWSYINESMAIDRGDTGE